MTELQQTTEPINWEVDKKKLPPTLNVLTILTLIASGLELITTIWGLFRTPPSEADLQEMQDKFDKAPDFVKNLMGSHTVELTRRTQENRISILILALIAIALCTYGAIQMRQWKKQGFYLYLLGELVVPLITMIVIIGMSYYGSFTLAISLLIPVLFIILYASQLKHLS